MTLKQISVFLENKKGRLAEVTKLIAAEKINRISIPLLPNLDEYQEPSGNTPRFLVVLLLNIYLYPICHFHWHL